MKKGKQRGLTLYYISFPLRKSLTLVLYMTPYPSSCVSGSIQSHWALYSHICVRGHPQTLGMHPLDRCMIRM